MRISSALLLGFASTGFVTAKVDCSQYQFTRQLDPLLSLDYVIAANADGQGTFSGRLTLEGEAWIGFGYSEAGGMVPGQSVIGSSDGVLKYTHTAKSPLGVNADLEQTLTDTSLVQNGTHTVMEFTKFLEEDGEVPINIGLNNFIFAYGSANNLEFHSGGFGRAPLDIKVCDAEDKQNIPSSSPSVDCASLSQTKQLSDELLFEWSLNTEGEEDILFGRLTLDREAWLAFGVTESEFGSMVPSDAIIGLQEAGFPQKYSIDGRNVNLINLADRQTLISATLEQANGQTIMTFNKILEEIGEIPIDASLEHTFIYAYGEDNTFGRHTASDRGSFKLVLDPCSDVDNLENTMIQGRSYKDFWTSHGAFAGIAWGILTPLAVAASLLRDLFPPGGLWFTAHIVLNMTTFVFTTIAFIFAFTAVHKSALPGDSPNHFVGIAHRSVGLAIMILTSLQIVGGVSRPHAPQKLEHGFMEEKQPARFTWEIFHKGVGFGLVATAWWQCQSGLTLFAELYGANDVSVMFLGVVGLITGATFLLFIYIKSSQTSQD